MPFHKLTQWLCYSLMVPMQKLLGMQFAGSELLTGLPEYRNGGLLIDTGLLSLKASDTARGIANYKENAKKSGKAMLEVTPMFEASDDVIVEWRGLTVGFLDLLLEAVNKGLGLEGSDQLSLAQMLEAGTWKVLNLFRPPCAMILTRPGWSRAGRSIAAQHQATANHDSFRRNSFLTRLAMGDGKTLLSHECITICIIQLEQWLGWEDMGIGQSSERQQRADD